VRERRRAVEAALMVVGVGSWSPSAASRVKRTYILRRRIHACHMRRRIRCGFVFSVRR
jgi:hypothetical protein